MRIVSTIDAAEIVHEGAVYKADANGTFEVPEEIGLELTGFVHFEPEWVARDRALAEEQARNTDAVRQAERIRRLEDEVAELRELIAKPKRTRRTKAEMEAAAAAGEQTDDDEADDSSDDE